MLQVDVKVAVDTTDPDSIDELEEVTDVDPEDVGKSEGVDDVVLEKIASATLTVPSSGKKPTPYVVLPARPAGYALAQLPFT